MLPFNQLIKKPPVFPGGKAVGGEHVHNSEKDKHPEEEKKKQNAPVSPAKLGIKRSMLAL